MIEKRFKAILKKYEKGTASKNEAELIENIFDNMQKEGDSFIKVKNNLVLKNRIYNAVESKKQSKLIWHWPVAASITFLIGFSFYMLMSNTDFLNKSPFYKTEMVLAQTQKSEQINVVLPDGSLVILNGNSAIEYPKIFNDTIRLVNLEGEAFFDVTKNPEKPFVIQSGNISTKVLGTSFNIKKIDSVVEVIVSTGLVNVTSKLDSVYLKPNQKVTYKNTSSKLYKEDVNAEIKQLWWKGEVVLAKIKMEELANELQELYKTPFVFKDNKLKNRYLYSFRLSKDESLNELIERINFITQVKLIKTSNMIEITKK
jgi:hypothetical protein